MRYLILCSVFFVCIFATDINVIDNNNHIMIQSDMVFIKIDKSPWHLTVMESQGQTIASEGDIRTGGSLPEPPDTPLEYYTDKHTFGPLTYRVDTEKRKQIFGKDIKGEAFHVENIQSWEYTNEGVRLTCSTSEVSFDSLQMFVDVHFVEDNIFYLKAHLSNSNGVWNFSETFVANPDEHYFGLGEHFNNDNSRGFVRGMQPEYAPGSKAEHNKTHVLVPFYISNNGYGIFAPIRRRGYFDMAASFNDLSRFTFDSKAMEFYFMVNKDPKKTMNSYMKMTGMPPLYPRWVFAPHQWRNVHNHASEVYEDMEKMRGYDIPGSVIWIDNPWQTEYNNFKFNTEQFPKIQELFQDMRAKGYRIALWSSEFVNSEASHFGEAMANGYFLNIDKNYTPFVMPWANGWGAPVNFINPDARKWWQEKIDSCMSIGVSGWKLDYGEIEDGLTATSLGVRFYNGKEKLEDVGIYRFNYHKTFNDMIQKKYDGDGFLICRTATFGDQVNNPCIWPGDLNNDFSFHEKGIVGGLPGAIAGGISVSMSGFPYYGSDIGGFRGGTPSKNSLIRWAQFAALSPVMQLGGGGNHLPWDFNQFDKETLEIYKKYARLHTDLFPYLYTYAKIASEEGLPIMRPLFMEYPQDTNACTVKFQYLFGENILVAPIYQDTTERELYLPEGTWIDYWTGQRFSGPLQMHVQAPLDTLPLYVKEGTVIPMADPTIDTLAEATDPEVVTWEQKRDHLVVMAFPGQNAIPFTLYDGTTVQSNMIAKNSISLQANSNETKRYTWIVKLTQKNSIKQIESNSVAIPEFTNEEEFEKTNQGWFQQENTLKVKVQKTRGTSNIIITFN